MSDPENAKGSPVPADSAPPVAEIEGVGFSANDLPIPHAYREERIIRAVAAMLAAQKRPYSGIPFMAQALEMQYERELTQVGLAALEEPE